MERTNNNERKVIQEHSLQVDVKKVVTTHSTDAAPGAREPFRTEKVDTRWIGGRVYTVFVQEGQSTEPTMTDEEVHAFLEKLDHKWSHKLKK